MSMYAKWTCRAVIQQLEQLKLYTSRKSATPDKYITKNNTRSNVECLDQREWIKAIS